MTRFSFHFYPDLAVLGCNVSEESMEVVKKVIDDIRPRLNLSRNLPIENLSPVDARSYLTRNPVRFCVLVVDAVTLRIAQESSVERKRDLEDLIRTAADNVGKNITCILTSAIEAYASK